MSNSKQVLAAIRELRVSLSKRAFMPVPPMQGPAPMQQGMPPQDPAMMMQQGMPQDPAMMQQGMPQQGPAPMQQGMPPQDPAMMQQGQAGPQDAAAGQPTEDPMNLLMGYMEELTTMVQQQQQRLDQIQVEIEHQKELRSQRDEIVKSTLGNLS